MLDERDVRIGDIWHLGSAKIQVCQPRNPCWKIDEKFACAGMAAYIAEHMLTGWYWRVIKPGVVRPGDTLALFEPAGDCDDSASGHGALESAPTGSDSA